MGRNKLTRKCSFKPKFKKFIPSPYRNSESMELDNDEIEAVFLMDYQDMYQEDAAKKMNISRPTISRIIKSARKKIATALILGYELNIIDTKDIFIVALSLQEKGSLTHLSNKNSLIALISIKNNHIINIEYIKNPIHQNDVKPSQVLPVLLKEHSVNYWITNQIGEGLKNSLHAKGIFIKEVEQLERIEDIIKLF